MQRLCIDLQNCYGIKSLKKEFDFTRNKANVIYAQNGAMKSSLAKTFKDFSEGLLSADRIYTARVTSREILDENGNEIPAENIFVIEPYIPKYESNRISTLLVNQRLKAEYDEILKSIEKRKDELIKELRKDSGLKNKIEESISKDIARVEDKLYIALGRVEKEIHDESLTILSDVLYSKIFTPQIETFLQRKDVIEQLKKYTETYDQLLSKSTFFKKGIFNHYHASSIAEILKNHGFFKADHSLYLNKSTTKKEVLDENELENIIKEEKENILNDPALIKCFEEIGKQMDKNAALREFREYLLSKPEIIIELKNIDLFKENLWKAYLVKHKNLYEALMTEYNAGKARIDEITRQASLEATKWQEVLYIFNERFSVPFKVSIENQEDVILKNITPNIKFEFTEMDENTIPVPVDRDDLIDVLSNGEKRALYILNIIFEIEARKSANIKTLFVIDDVADSFDYKNKYAIVEYLHDILNEGDFYQLILTHNYDFYRTISSRLELNGTRYHAVKDENGIKLEQETMYQNPFNSWKTKFHDLNNSHNLIAMIPFVRNLAEFCGNSLVENKLTSLLHIKSDTDTITIKELLENFREILSDNLNCPNERLDSTVKQIIYEAAEKLILEPSEGIELDKKIALSIAIRLKTEEFLINKINDLNFINNINSNQTGKLIRKYKKLYMTNINEKNNMKIIERVNLMTPENIHINSFMYEPII
ncbi:hypothetical protein NB640_10375 [Oxalobacter vibrioformis]|uniref:Protein CR006 P-loop domain-containing protein n=1 Tax=Oxalobacter vibrioformis TaxID=933080 RepID=A0A9E9P280_9BURK|nr:hypothetical protein [Oxalobacter vibrioformis]WAW09627.1 hypothetical protein NB640_10375 [Oxalobacter vibrioformis]